MRRGDYDIVPYQSTHNYRGTIMGNDPKTSVVNRYLQTGTRTNLFSWRLHLPATAPTSDRTGARSPIGRPRRITRSYLQSPGPLVQA